MELEFRGPLIEWRGPSPYHFVVVPEDESAAIEALARAVTYGWGMIPVRVTVGRTEFRTALYAKDGGYLLPVKDAVRRAERLAVGDEVGVRLALVGA